MKEDFDGELEVELAYYQQKYYTLLRESIVYRNASNLWKGVSAGSLMLNIFLIGLLVWDRI